MGMKNFLSSFVLIAFCIFISSDLLGQSLDTNIINNLSSDQINVAKEILSEESNKKLNVSEGLSSDNEKESLKEKKYINSGGTDSNKFGYNFISSSPTSIIATGDIPLPNDYKISVGDVMGVVLSGSKDQIFDIKVQLDGTVFFPELGSISVAGESFEEVKDKFRNLISKSFIGASINLSLKDLSAKKITIVGVVNNPGTYLVNPFTTISNSLAYSGGIKSIGSLREIKLIRSNGENFIFDLYDLLIEGDRTNDITIESGDVIIVGAADKFVEISGQVKRPGIYEMKKGENLSDLLRYSLGFEGSANVNKLTLSKFDIRSNSITKIITDDTKHHLIEIDSVKVYPLQIDISNNILVSGAVKEPGYYELKNYPTLEGLIDKLEFVDVYPWLGVLEQFDEENLVKSSILFSLNDPNTYKSIRLLPNSRIYFSNIDARTFNVSDMSAKLINEYELTIKHKQATYNIPVFGKYSIKSFIDLLGLDMSDVINEATYISPLENIILKDNYKNMDFVAKKYNRVSFRSPINNLITVNISGAIDYPGTYTLQPNATLQDLYNLVGSFKDEAFSNGIIFTRESIRERQIKSIQKSKDDLNKVLLTNAQKGEKIGDINILRALSESIEPENLGRIAGDFSPRSISSNKTILLDGDSIFVPRNPNVINVLGEVLNPIAFEYNKSITVRSAITNSGGYQSYADKRRVYVIKANGLIERANRNIFTKDVKLEPGDTIVVPRKIITNNPGIDALIPITRILSDLSFSAAALETLSNNN